MHVHTADNLARQIHHTAALLFRETDQILFGQFGIGLAQYKILSVVKEHPYTKQLTIANTLGQTEASISRQIKLLQQAGMIVAIKNPDNRREHLITATTRGQNVTEAANKALSLYYDNFFKKLSTKQQKQLVALLRSTQ